MTAAELERFSRKSGRRLSSPRKRESGFPRVGHAVEWMPASAGMTANKSGSAKIAPALRKHARCDRGFTLLELLVSLTLLALILTALPAALRLGKRSLELERDYETRSTTQAALTFLEQRLTESMSLYRRGDDGLIQIMFSGAPEAVRFTAPLSAGPIGGGIYAFTVSVREQEESRSLVLTWSPFSPDQRENVPSESRTLLSDIAEFRLRYFGALKEGADPSWQDNWTRRDVLPSLVEIICRRKGDTAYPTRLVVELRTRAG